MKLEKMGIEFHHRDISKGEWIELPEWNKRSKRKKEEGELEKIVKRAVNKPKKVKPGYKKKMREEIEKQKKRLRRLQKR